MEKPVALEEYVVMIGGMEHTVLLDAEEAERRGAVKVKAKAPANKSKNA